MKIEIELDDEALLRIQQAILCHQSKANLPEISEPSDYIEMLIQKDLEFVESEFMIHGDTGEIKCRETLIDIFSDLILKKMGLKEMGILPPADIEISVQVQALENMRNEGWLSLDESSLVPQ